MRRLLVTVALCAGVAWAGSAPALPEGDAKPIVARVCSSCHSLDLVTQKKWTHEEWQTSVAAMIQRGAPLSKEQAATVIAYLTRNFGTRDRAHDLFVDVCSYCHELARIARYAMTKEQWRDETNGMISEGAPVTDEELDLLLNYLEKNFGPDHRVPDNLLTDTGSATTKKETK